MRKITFFTLSLLCAFLVASCSDEITNISDSYDDAEIQVSEKALEYGKEGGTKTFTVTVNEKNNFIVQWANNNNVEWGKISREGNIVTVTVEANEIVKSRTAQILIYTQNGGLQEFVDIIQTETDLIFDAIPTEIEFTRLGGDKIIKVTTNATDWTVEGEVDWLNVESKFAIGEVKLTAQKSNLEQERTSVITLKKGTITKEINIIQKGSHELVFPCHNFGSLLQELIKFEEDRGNFYYYVAAGIFNPESHHIKTLSSLTPSIELDMSSGLYTGATILNTIPKEDVEGSNAFLVNYSALLIENGYTKLTMTDFTINLPSQSASVNATIYRNGVVFEFISEQPEPMPTFNEFPYGYMEWGVNEAEIRTYETSKGGTYNISESDGATAMVFNAKADDPDVSSRVYFFRTSPYTNYYQNGMEFRNTEKMYYFEQNGKRHLTKEYEALLAKEGFAFLQYDNANELEIYSKPSPKGGNWHVIAYHYTDGTIAVIQIGEGQVTSGISPLNMQELDVTKIGYRNRDRHVGSDNSSQWFKKYILK